MTVLRRWSWTAVLIVGLLLFLAVQRALVATQNPNLVPTLILLGAAVVPVSFVTFMAGRRLAHGVGEGVVGLTALAGGVVGVVTASVLEYDTLRRLGVLPIVLVGLIEEAAKLLVLVVVMLALRPRHRADGLVLGVAAGAGFAVLETMGFAFVELIRSGGNLAALDDLLLLRGVLSPAAHMAWTGLCGAALWWAMGGGDQLGRAWARFLGVFVLAVGLHTAWDTFVSVPAYIAIALLSLGLLVAFAHQVSSRADVPVHAPRDPGPRSSPART